MNRISLARFSSCLFVALLACAAPAPRAPSPLDEAFALGERMVGSYSSEAQSLADKEFRDVRLHMTRIWPERKDGCWLYVEQAMATALERPYRQRIYCVQPCSDGSTASHVFELPGVALEYVGAWSEPARFAALSPEQLVQREGCTVYLRREGDAWRGSTRASDCISTLNGAAYATSEVVVTATSLTSWDRGYDKAGKQVWGAVKGAYVFDRQ